MDTETIRQVRERAAGRCEYCQLDWSAHPAPFQIDHIIAKQHGGLDEPGNLALACIHCNRYKGPNIAGIDPNTGELTRLFHPRMDEWHKHFSWNGAEILPITAIGGVTLRVLFMNDPELVWVRASLTV